MITERSEGGFFARVISIHPLARKSQIISIAPDHDLVECGFDALPGGLRWRWLRILYAPLYVIRAVVVIRRLIRTEQVDIVRASDPYWGAFIAWLGALGVKAHFVISVHADWDLLHKLDPHHGAPKLFGSRQAARALAGFLLHRAERVFCIRKSLFASVKKLGVRDDKIRLIPHGIDLNPFIKPSLKPQIDIPPDRKIIFFAGRLSRENYIDDIIAVGHALSHRKDTILVIAGGGPEEARLKATIAQRNRGKETAIRFLGFCPREEVLRLRMAATINLALMGGFSLIEACASGRPTIAYDIEWHSELIEDGISGCLIAESDIDKLVQTVEDFLDNPKKAEIIGKAGRERAFALHDIKKIYPIRAAAYQELLE